MQSGELFGVDLIKNARKEIPSLVLLHQKIHTELPRRAHLIAQKYLKSQEKKYQRHILGLRNSILKITSKLGSGFEFEINCPEKNIAIPISIRKRLSVVLYSKA